MTTLATTNKLSSQITGNDYFSAYRSRMQINNDYFLQIAKELTEMGYSVYTPKDGLIDFIYIEKDNTHLYFGFADVPYRWYLSYNIDYTKGKGSGRKLKEGYDYDSPFTALQISESMQPNAKQVIDSKRYMKLFTTA